LLIRRRSELPGRPGPGPAKQGEDHANGPSRLSRYRRGGPRLAFTVVPAVLALVAAVAFFAAADGLISGRGSPGNSNFGTSRSDGHTSDAGPATAPAPLNPGLSWPDEGQASVLVEGLGKRGDLGAKGEQTPVPIASITKVMTAYVVLQDHPLRGDEPGPDITVDQEAAAESYSADESTAPVILGERISERRLLELMLIPSGNNIARLLARWDAGSQQAFVAKMNRAARALAMDQTTYTGASGVEPTTTSTSADQLKLAQPAMRYKAFRTIVDQSAATSPGVPGRLLNTNSLLGKDGVIGIKTGSSTPAGGTLIWAATARDASGHSRLILGVVLGQNPGVNPEEGLSAALDSSRKLVNSVRRWLSTTEPGTR
jgi:D-alanyl-D-alanine carboxypeptidase (penicillin-binding protein 5/6)